MLVTVVPIFAPMMMGIAGRKSITGRKYKYRTDLTKLSCEFKSIHTDLKKNAIRSECVHSKKKKQSEMLTTTV